MVDTDDAVVPVCRKRNTPPQPAEVSMDQPVALFRTTNEGRCRDLKN